MIRNQNRIGNCTSSEIVALTKLAKDGKSFGVPALTYIAECNMERRLGRSLTDESNARPLTWGKLGERHVFDNILGTEYALCSLATIVHPTINHWSGSPDGTKKDTVADIKAPMTLKSFCQLVDPVYAGLSGEDAMKVIRETHKDGEKYYWQLVSNAILTQKQFAELIVYVPYKSELDEIRRLAQSVEPDQLSKHYWIAMALEDELPHLIDGGYYKNLTTIRFEVPQADKDLLTAKVLKAGELLIQPALIAEHKPELGATIIETVNI